MKAKLIKVDNGWVLMVDNIMYTTDNDKLSLKNCQAIELGYDLDDKISEHLEKNHIEASTKRVQVIKELILELLGGKKFSERDMLKAIIMASSIPAPIDGKIWKKRTPAEIVNSLQPTEWEVEFNPDELDANGCLILKLKSE